MLPNIIEVAISNDNETVTISMIKHTSIESLQDAIGGINSQYQISMA